MLPQDRFFEYTAPQDGSAGFTFGGSFVAATSSVAGSQDLRKIAAAANAVQQQTVQQQSIDCTNDGTTTIYVLFGQTAPTPIIASTGVNTAGNCRPIFAGQTLRYWLRPNVDNFIGYVASDGGSNAWDASSLWYEDTTWAVASPWA